MDNQTISITFRLPAGLHRKLQEIAKEQRRSMQNQLVVILDDKLNPLLAKTKKKEKTTSE